MTKKGQGRDAKAAKTPLKTSSKSAPSTRQEKQQSDQILSSSTSLVPQHPDDDDDDDDDNRSFPPDFVWGCATSAYQIEGAHDADGKGPSIWDKFVHTPGRVANGDHADVACDHYHKVIEDVELMASLGFKAYRFSISWPRVLPTGGVDNVNAAGVAFYNKLIDALCERGITPLCTLYHWDLPLALEDSFGGFLSPSFVPAFAAYAKFCFQSFGDRVKSWITFNEPSCVCVLGYGLGVHAPGRNCAPGTEVYTTSHHLLLAHAHAVKEYRKLGGSGVGLGGSSSSSSSVLRRPGFGGGRIGITLNSEWWEAKSPHAEDVKAARRALDFTLGIYAAPIWGEDNDYPASVRAAAGDRLPTFTAEEKRLLKGSSDFFGLNHYSTRVVGRESALETVANLPREVRNVYECAGSHVRGFVNAIYPMVNPFMTSYFKDMGVTMCADGPDTEYTFMRWAIKPWGFRKLLNYIQDTYNPDGGIVITENGVATDEPTVKDMEEDINSKRVPYVSSYIAEMRKAIYLDNVNVTGYFYWSFFDNFEWSFGNDKRFGLVRVDYDTLERTPKPVARWFTKLMEDNRLPTEEEWEQEFVKKQKKNIKKKK